MKIAVCIMARQPELGKVKTRLAADSSEVFALEAYKKLLFYTWNCIPTHFDAYVAATPAPLDECPFPQFLQAEGDLGARLSSAAKILKSQSYEGLIFVGSDCAELLEEHFEQAALALKANTICIGPATDGGYYLIAIRAGEDFVFENMPWSSPDLLQASLDRCVSENKKVTLLETLSDIDHYEDIEPHLTRLGLLAQQTS